LRVSSKLILGYIPTWILRTALSSGSSYEWRVKNVMFSQEPIIQVCKGKDLPADQSAEVYSLCSQAYKVDFKPILDSFSDSTHILAYLDDVLVSHALWITRWMQVDHSLMLRTAYVEAVATHPDFQNCGLGSMVMRAVQAEIQDFDLGGLSPSDDRWYARLGWERWQGPLFIRKGEKLLPTPGEDVMILRLPRTPKLDLKAPLSAEWRDGELW
jgi:aminoglycoside 2'-N-acetyltransferase I